MKTGKNIRRITEPVVYVVLVAAFGFITTVVNHNSDQQQLRDTELVSFTLENEIEDLYYQDKGASKYPEGVVDAFAEALQFVEAAKNMRDLYAMKSFHVEKLKGRRGKQNERSIRLTNQYRLIFKIEETKEGQRIVVIDISDLFWKP